MSVNPLEKHNCWTFLQSRKSTYFCIDYVIVGDFNVIRNKDEKTGGSFGRDPLHEKIEKLIKEWDLIDVKPQHWKLTWSNMRIGPGNIVSHLYCLLVHINFFHQNSTIKSLILPSLISDHKLISLNLHKILDYGPLPFHFNPLWINS
jgi:hypothetical protein